MWAFRRDKLKKSGRRNIEVTVEAEFHRRTKIEVEFS